MVKPFSTPRKVVFKEINRNAKQRIRIIAKNPAPIFGSA
jgi:hypothetical protein